MSEMVERVAEIITDGVGRDLPSAEIARAVIEAMRELTEPMRLAGNKWTGYHGPDSTDVWHEMIDAALNTNQETEA